MDDHCEIQHLREMIVNLKIQLATANEQIKHLEFIGNSDDNESMRRELERMTTAIIQLALAEHDGWDTQRKVLARSILKQYGNKV